MVTARSTADPAADTDGVAAVPRPPLEELLHGSCLVEAPAACLRDIELGVRLAYEDVLRAVDASSRACEGLLEVWETLEGQCRSQVHNLLREIGDRNASASTSLQGDVDSAPRPFSGVYSSLGIGPASPAHAALEAALAPAGNALMEPRCFEEPGQHGPQQALEEGARLLGEMEDLGRRLKNLRTCWPSLRDTVSCAVSANEPLQNTGLAWILQELLRLRDALTANIRTVATACLRLQDGVEQVRTARLERLQWKALTRNVMGDLGPTIARVTARRRGNQATGTSYNGSGTVTTDICSQKGAALNEGALRRQGGAAGRRNGAEGPTSTVQEFRWLDFAAPFAPWFLQTSFWLRQENTGPYLFTALHTQAGGHSRGRSRHGGWQAGGHHGHGGGGTRHGTSATASVTAPLLDVANAPKGGGGNGGCCDVSGRSVGPHAGLLVTVR